MSVYVPPTRISAKEYQELAAKKAAAPKYKNKKVMFQGQQFDSIGERDRFVQLQEQERDGKIRNLKCQVTFKLAVNGVHICKYIADFVYEQDDQRVVEDFKGIETDVFKLKEKLMLACHGIEIIVTKRRAWKSGSIMEGKTWKPRKTKPKSKANA